MTESRTDEAMEPDLSRLLVQLLQVLLAFFLGQTLIQNREVLQQLGEAGTWVPLLAIIAVVAFAVDGWVDWHVDVDRHPFQIGPSNPHRRWGLARFWLDVAFVLTIGYLGQTIVTVAEDGALITRHLTGYVVAHLLVAAAGRCRDVTYSGDRDGDSFVQLLTAAVLVVVVLVYRAVHDGDGSAENAVVLLVVTAINIAHHAVLRGRRMIA